MKNKIKILIYSISTLLIVFFVISFIYVFKKYSYSNNSLNPNEYFKLSNDNDVAICLNDTVCEEKGLFKNNTYYLPYRFVINNLNDRFYYDIESNSLLFTIPNQILSYSDSALSYDYFDKKITTSYPLFLLEDNIGYISCDLISKHTNISYEIFNNPNRIQIYSKINNINRVKVKKNTNIRITGGVKSDIIVSVNKGEKIDLIKKDSKWSKVHTTSGFTGYIRTNKISKSFYENISTNYEQLSYPSIKYDSDVTLGFDQTLSKISNNTIQDRIKNTNINILCPTWFYLNDTYGNMSDNLSKEYIDEAHLNNIDVWPVINDFDGQNLNGGINSPEETLSLLQSKNARTNIINQIIDSYNIYKFDGINIDFENVNNECSTHYLQFIRELSIATHKLNIILSVDNYVPTYSKHYNRKEESVFCDYLILMGYDEYGSHSDKPGPNSSYPFVNQGIIDTLEEVSNDKLILALPFYSKIWFCNKDGSFYTDSIDMESAISRKDYFEVKFKEDIGYNYVEYEREGNTIKLWIEDEKSLSLKKNLINKYNLKGVAYWKLGLEIPSFWDEKE